MEEKELLVHQAIENKIYVVRGQKVMIDRDLAELYNVETRVFNQAVKRNLERFPEDFMFQLTENEFRSLTSQIVMSSWGGIRHVPKVFTEHGILMLSSVLNNSRAIQINIQIMRTFARIRQMLSDNTELRLEIEQIKKKINNHDQNIEIVFRYIDELLEKKENPEIRNQIGFK